MEFCPVCNKVAEYDASFGRVVCTSCNWRSEKEEKVIYHGDFEKVKEAIMEEYLAGDTELCGFFSAYTPDLNIEEQVRLYAQLRLECDGDECYRVIDYPEVENLATGAIFKIPSQRNFNVDTPLGKLKVWSKHEGKDCPDDYPGVFIDWISPVGTEEKLLSCVEYDPRANGVYAHMYADFSGDTPTDSVLFEDINNCEDPKFGLKDADGKHDYEPTDSQGYTMECCKCGRVICIHNTEDWEKGLCEPCTAKVI